MGDFFLLPPPERFGAEERLAGDRFAADRAVGRRDLLAFLAGDFFADDRLADDLRAVDFFALPRFADFLPPRAEERLAPPLLPRELFFLAAMIERS